MNKQDKLSYEDRCNLYAEAFPDWPAPRFTGRWVEGMWILGNSYRNKAGLYGAYPPNYLKRVAAMFPEPQRILHLFSGSLTLDQMDAAHPVRPGRSVSRFDLVQRVDDWREGYDCLGSAERLSEYYEPDRFDLVIADPPYSVEDSERYGTCMVKRNVVFHQTYKVLKKGGNIVWLDQVLPQYKKSEVHLWGAIGMVRSTNHRFRLVSMFEKV